MNNEICILYVWGVIYLGDYLMNIEICILYVWGVMYLGRLYLMKLHTICMGSDIPG